MDPPANGRERGGGRGVRPMLLAAGIALMWFVQFQGDAAPADAPGWGMGLIIGGRLLADFVGAALVVAGLRLVLAAIRLGLAHWRLQRTGGMG
jgi:hypothetical protein